MLTKEAIEANKEEFIQLVRSIKREGCDIEGLIKKLEASDFFTAPASTRFHGAYEGGLCDHSLSVYHNMCSLVKSKHLEEEISEDTVKIVTLLHDFSKMNLYKRDYRNKKVYCEEGSKHDAGGNFEWVVEESYSTAPLEERFIYGNHEETSEFMIRQYIPLEYKESAAILSHHGGMSYDSSKADISPIYDRYPVALLLHLADMLSCYIEKA